FQTGNWYSISHQIVHIGANGANLFGFAGADTSSPNSSTSPGGPWIAKLTICTGVFGLGATGAAGGGAPPGGPISPGHHIGSWPCHRGLAGHAGRPSLAGVARLRR